MEHLVTRDRMRHAKLSQRFADGVVSFPVEGSPDPYLVGLYFTKVRLGSPPREFNVQIDTGSDVLWVSCNSCSNCPQSSGLGIHLNSFNPTVSSTSGVIKCSDRLCALASLHATQTRWSQDNQCTYSFQYGDGSGTSGYYVYDMLHFDVVLEATVFSTSTIIAFGCSTEQSGDLTKMDKAVDGIFGFGQGDISVTSQLASQGIAPNMFSHCLKGKGNGGGVLVLGEVFEPGIAYTPLVGSKPHYNVDLWSISVDGLMLPIDPKIFATSDERGTIIDSGTTLAYLVEEAYDPLINAVTAVASQNATPTIVKGHQCYLVSSSLSEVFPQVGLNFVGGASMTLKPEEYLVMHGNHDGASLWCVGFQRVQEITILGDLVLKDKIVVYDLVHQRIGWTNYDCSLPVNVSVMSGKDFINQRQTKSDSKPRNKRFNRALLVIVIYLFILGNENIPL